MDSDLSSTREHSKSPGFVGGHRHPWDRAISNSDCRSAGEASRRIPILRWRMEVLRRAILALTISPRRRARFSGPPSASWKCPRFWFSDISIAVLKGDHEEMDRAVSQAKGKRRAEHWMAHEEALALARSGRLQAARTVFQPRRGAGPARGGTRVGSELPGSTSGVGGSLRECCRRDKGAHWRRSSFPRAETSNTPPALLWRFQGNFLNRGRSPAIWKSASRKIRL